MCLKCSWKAANLAGIPFTILLGQSHSSAQGLVTLAETISVDSASIENTLQEIQR